MHVTLEYNLILYFMFKFFRLTAFLFTLVLTTFIAEASLSNTLSLQKTQVPKVIKPDANVPICYMKMANGNILNLSNLCKQELIDFNTRSNRISPRARNDSRMKKSDDELYGKGN